MEVTPHITLVVQSVPPIVTRVANPMDVAGLIIERVFVRPVVAGLLQIGSTSNNWISSATTVLFHRPFAKLCVV